ncbi:head-tail connector protein [Salinicola aestuarinus]|uniref:head-tail connector protein n=1 Tax=Salinicola aestuarinus TaxID=1949082 RepID=UPI000DA217E8|nr:head-tail connector protein [Salinicola aestuarinus]
MLELDIIKQHVRLEPDFEDDDTLLDTYSNAARRMVENQTGRSLFASQAEADKSGKDNALLLDDDITTAMLLIIGHWYANRESVAVGVSVTEMPMAVASLIEPYRFFHF